LAKKKLPCLAELEVVNIQNHYTVSFRCDLKLGHEGEHHAKGTANFYPNLNSTECHDGDYTMTWVPGLSAREPYLRCFLSAKEAA